MVNQDFSNLLQVSQQHIIVSQPTYTYLFLIAARFTTYLDRYMFLEGQKRGIYPSDNRSIRFFGSQPPPVGPPRSNHAPEASKLLHSQGILRFYHSVSQTVGLRANRMHHRQESN